MSSSESPHDPEVIGFGLIHSLYEDKPQDVGLTDEVRSLIEEAAVTYLGEDRVNAVKALYSAVPTLKKALREREDSPIRIGIKPQFDTSFSEKDCTDALEIAALATGRTLIGAYGASALVAMPDIYAEDILERDSNAPRFKQPSPNEKGLLGLLFEIDTGTQRAYAEEFVAYRALIGETGKQYFGWEGEHIADVLEQIMPEIEDQAKNLATGKIEDIKPILAPAPSGTIDFFARALQIAAKAKSYTFVGAHNDVLIMLHPDGTVDEALDRFDEARRAGR